MATTLFHGNGRPVFSWRHSHPVPIQLRVRLHVELLEDRQLLSTVTNPAAAPTPGDYPYWYWREAQNISASRGNPDVVFLGDSITDAFATTVGAPVWGAAIAPLRADNFGIGGNTTQMLLWQIDHDGVLDGLSPRVVVLLIGTNNLAEGQSPAQTAEGIAATVTAIQTKQPQAEILLLGILPRGASADDPMRSLVAQTNQLIAPLGSLSQVTYLDIGAAFLQGDGSISPQVMADYLHPTLLGYERMTVALMPSLDQWLQSPAPPHQGPRPAFPVGNFAASASTLTVQPGASSADTLSVITGVLPRPDGAPVAWPIVAAAPGPIGQAIRNDAAITNMEAVSVGSAVADDASLIEASREDASAPGDWAAWTGEVWGPT